MSLPSLNPLPLLRALADEGVEYVLIGGLAAAMMGTTRVTRDIDLTYATNYENLERLALVLNRFEPRIKLLVDPTDGVVQITAALLRRERILQLITMAGEVDLLDKISGFATYGQVKKYARMQDVGVSVQVLGIKGLIRAKKALKRPKDVQDLLELQALAEVESQRIDIERS